MASAQTAIRQANPSAATANARRSRRDTLVTAGQIWASNTPGQGKPIPVSVMNVSLEGIAFRSRSSFTKGQSYYLRLIAGPLQLEGPICIAWCRNRSDGAYDTGAAFVRQ